MTTTEEVIRLAREAGVRVIIDSKLNRFGLIPITGDDNLGFTAFIEVCGEFLRNCTH